MHCVCVHVPLTPPPTPPSPTPPSPTALTPAAVTEEVRSQVLSALTPLLSNQAIMTRACTALLAVAGAARARARGAGGATQLCFVAAPLRMLPR